MIFVIPIILGAAALGTAAVGVVKGAKGVKKMKKAKKIVNKAQEEHELAVSQFKAEWEATNKLAEEYGRLQVNIIMHTVGRFVTFIERNGQRASQSEKQFLEGLDISVQQIKEYKAATVKAEQFFKGSAKALGAAAVGYGGAISLATSVGVASTGTAISGLSGAAATNATLAWLGGGSLAAGGGGMALGSLVLGGITLGPALKMGGFVLASEGKKAKTRAREYEAEVKTAIAKIDAAKEVSRQVNRRITELRDILENLNARAVVFLNDLESKPFERQKHANKFQQVALLIKALVEIMKTPILDNQGNLNPATTTIKAKYRTLGGN